MVGIGSREHDLDGELITVFLTNLDDKANVVSVLDIGVIEGETDISCNDEFNISLKEMILSLK